MNQELTVPGAVQTQDIKISPKHSQLATRVNGGWKKVLVNRKNSSWLWLGGWSTSEANVKLLWA